MLIKNDSYVPIVIKPYEEVCHSGVQALLV